MRNYLKFPFVKAIASGDIPKLENSSLHRENDFFQILEKNVPMGVLSKISKNLRECLGVKAILTSKIA